MCFKQRLWFVGANTKLLAIMVCQFYGVETRDVSHPAVWCPANTDAVQPRVATPCCCPVRLQAHVRQDAGDADFFVRGGLAAFVIFQDFVDHVSSPADYDGIGLQVVGKSDQ